MKIDKGNRVFVYLLVAAGLCCLGSGLLFGIRTKITRVHSAKQEARRSYTKADYSMALSSLQYLVDSLSFAEEAGKLDMAHAGFLVSRYDSAKLARDRAKDGYPFDSSAVNTMRRKLDETRSLATYQQLSEMSEQDDIASKAFNQLGIIAYNLRKRNLETEAMTEAAGYFKSALKKDPSNDFARYNYELIRKRIDYPGMIMSRVRSLIHQRKYRQARNELMKAFEKDNQMKTNYSDYVQRLESIIKIDSLSRP